jgi:transposase
MRRHELSDEEWGRIEALLPAERGRRGRPQELSNRRFLNAILYIAKTGVPWRDLPERFGPWRTVYSRFTRWNARGIFQSVIDHLGQHADHAANLADGSYVKAHQDAAGAKGGPAARTLDALAAALPPRSTHSWTLSVVPYTSTSQLEIATISVKRAR